MENIFLKYMNDKLSVKVNKPKTPGPVITISREYGCYGTQIAKLVTENINKNQSTQWQMISNEILSQVAKNLMVTPDRISHVFGAEVKGAVEDFFSAFSISKRYVSDANVVRYISDIVTSYANEGNVVIVGRAGCVLTKHIKKSLHIKIIAPLDWRVASVANRFEISTEEAKAKVLGIDAKRHTFMEMFNGIKPESELFDLVVNRATLTNEEIVDTIITIAKSRDLIY